MLTRMLSRLRIPILLVLLAFGVFMWWWNRPERVVARRVAGLFEAANVPADMGNIGRGTRGGALEPFLAKSITFEGPDGPTEQIDGPQPKDYIMGAYSQVATACRSASVQDVQVEDVTVNGEEADVTATVDAVIEMPDGTKPVDGIEHLEMKWLKQDGKWVLSRAKWRETGRK